MNAKQLNSSYGEKSDEIDRSHGKNAGGAQTTNILTKRRMVKGGHEMQRGDYEQTTTERTDEHSDPAVFLLKLTPVQQVPRRPS